MIKDAFRSKYAKLAGSLILAGLVLMLINNMIGKANVKAGLAHINGVMMPIYIGIAIAFLFCPLYNRIVRALYSRFSHRLKRDGNVPLVDDGIVDAVKNEGKDPAILNHRVLVLAKTAASLVCILIMFTLVALISYFLLPRIFDSIVSVISTMPERLATFAKWSEVHLSKYPKVAEMANRAANAGSDEVIAWVEKHILKSYGAANLASILSMQIIKVLKAFLDIIIGILIAIYLLNYKEKLFAIFRKMTTALFQPKTANGLFEFAHTINDVFIGYIVGRILDAIVIGILTYITMRIIGIPLALLISVIVGVTNIIPFFGPFLGAIPSFCLLLLQDPVKALYFAVMILAIQQLDGNVIGPKIVGTVIGISSFWVLIAVLVGGGLFGFIGMVLGVPVFVIIYKYINILMVKKLDVKEEPVLTSSYYRLEKYGISDPHEIMGAKHSHRKRHREAIKEAEKMTGGAAAEGNKEGNEDKKDKE